MHEQNIETLRDEALRLIDLQLEILREMLNAPGVIAESATGEIQTFDRNNTLKYIEVLEGEKTKLDRLELVLAVVGTMKAGKSTTINAIVGTEVLPNRNRPMTALPTLIKHTPGQIEPVLKFENSLPIEKLMQELSQLVNRPDNKEFVEHLAKNEHMEDLLKLIDTQLSLEKTYKGAQSIFQFLETLNDLVRLSRELDVAFPFSDYDEIHELPVIEIEFVHLREQNDSTGTLTLLDTPGPNESGQPHLRKMLKDQLKKASVVLAVLDFTQLKSDADAQVRENLKDIANITERLYALVNKFDQQDRNSDSAEETKLFVSNSLMEGKIAEKLIFPVSSKFAYLANYARREIDVYGTLPDHRQHPWVKDFGTEAFGRSWKNSITNLEKVKEGVDLLWDDSLFHAPLEKIIHSAHAQAALIAVASASEKLVYKSEKLNNFFNTRESGLTKDSQELKIIIDRFQNDIISINSIEDSAKKRQIKYLWS